jgi:hypothetical protein
LIYIHIDLETGGEVVQSTLEHSLKLPTRISISINLTIIYTKSIH